ncbi:MAG: TetR family transcriptional regulator [Hyphomicrobiales bacterium]
MARANTKTTRNGHRANFEARRESIIATATRLYARQGFRGTSVTDICNEEDLTRGLLYYYVPGGKLELLQAINDRFQSALMEDWPRIAATDLRADDALRELSRSLMRAIFRYLDEVTVFLHEWKNLREDPKRWAEYQKKRDYLSDIIRNTIVRGQEQGLFKKLDPTVLGHAFGGMHNWAYQWVHRRGSMGPDEISDIFCEVFLAGLRQPDTV